MSCGKCAQQARETLGEAGVPGHQAMAAWAAPSGMQLSLLEHCPWCGAWMNSGKGCQNPRCVRADAQATLADVQQYLDEQERAHPELGEDEDFFQELREDVGRALGSGDEDTIWSLAQEMLETADLYADHVEVCEEPPLAEALEAKGAILEWVSDVLSDLGERLELEDEPDGVGQLEALYEYVDEQERQLEEIGERDPTFFRGLRINLDVAVAAAGFDDDRLVRDLARELWVRHLTYVNLEEAWGRTALSPIIEAKRDVLGRLARELYDFLGEEPPRRKARQPERPRVRYQAAVKPAQRPSWFGRRYRDGVAVSRATKKGPGEGCQVLLVGGNGERAFLDQGSDTWAMRVGIDMDLLRKHYEATSHVFIPGGADVDPRFYGEEPHPRLGFTDAGRDEWEIELARMALKDKKPVFGICRGHQVITVAAGGTLIQDIGSEVPGALNHRGTDHWIDIAPDSRLAQVLGETRIKVNSLHHQATRDVPPGWKAVAWAPDGIIEAIEPEDASIPVVSVQFHPEMVYKQDRRFARLFEWFMKQR